MEIIGNPWFIGIGGGILSGLIVTIITRYIFSRRDNREYAQKVLTANHEVLYAVRPGISEGVIPPATVVDSLIRATAEKYAVDARDLHQPPALADMLTKEIMDSSFLAASVKAQYCERLSALIPTVPKEGPAPTPPAAKTAITEVADYRRRTVQMMSGMLGLMAALMTMSFGALSLIKDSDVLKASKSFSFLIPTVMTIFVAFVTTYAAWLMRILERRRKRDEEQKDTKEREN